jgi:hypothetical protein
VKREKRTDSRQMRGCFSAKQSETWTTSKQEVISTFAKASGAFDKLGAVLSNSFAAANERYCARDADNYVSSTSSMTVSDNG